MTTNHTAIAMVLIFLFGVMVVGCERTPNGGSTAQNETVRSTYYSSNILAQALKVGVSKEEVTAVFGQPTTEFVPGEIAEYYCLTYMAPSSKARRKKGEHEGFQVLLRDNKLVKWSPVLSSTDAE